MKQMVKNWKILESLRDFILGNKEKNSVEIGVNLEVDGDLQVNSDLEVNGNIVVNGIENFRDKDGGYPIKNLEDAVNGESTVEITITDDDYDEDANIYIKHIEINNAFIQIDYKGTHDDAELVLYNPYFKSCLYDNSGLINGFEGYKSNPEERNVFFEGEIGSLPILSDGNTCLNIFNGIISGGQIFL